MRFSQQERMTKLFWLIQNERDPNTFMKFVEELLALLNSVYEELVTTRESAAKARAS